MLASTIPKRAFSLGVGRLGGQKAKRRKKNSRVDNPHLPVKKGDSTPKSIALTHFDEFYSKMYQNRWSSLRIGLLCQQKYCAVVNNFGDTEDTIEKLEDLGCINVGKQVMLDQRRLKEYVPEEKVVPEEPEDLPVVEEEVVNVSLGPDQAQHRIINPEERSMGGGSTSALYDFVPTTELKGMEEFVEEADYYKYYKRMDQDDVRIVGDHLITWPNTLQVFTFPRGVTDSFPSPKGGMLNTLNYYCMDLASVLPVLALDIQPGDRCLDMCSGPGGKALVMLQTLCPSELVCNDVDYHRMGRVINVMSQYLGPGDGVAGARATVSISRRDGASLTDYQAYDRVLLDAPCYSDRHAVTSDEDNSFVKTNIKNRLKMPEKQMDLLKNGLLLLKPGGCLVYSTCTLSPVQNDGVVHQALRFIWENTNLDFEVCDLDFAMKPLRTFLKIHSKKEGMKYGQLVVPFLPNNFGPMYFAKIRRVK